MSDVYWNTNLKAQLFKISALSNRGESASIAQKEAATEIICSLEADNPAYETDAPRYSIRGEWELIYTDAELFMSSPFFMFVRELFGGNFEQAQEVFELHRRATSTGRIEGIKQIITDSELRSEVELNVGIIPGPPYSLKGTVVSTADLEYEDKFTIKATFKETKVKNSPFSFVLDQLPSLPIKQIYETINGGDSLPSSVLTTYYLDDDMRITRTLDDTVFVYAKKSVSEGSGTLDGSDVDNNTSQLFSAGSTDEGINENGEIIYLSSPDAGE